MKRIISRMLGAACLLGAMVATQAPAQTDGSATCTVTTASTKQNYDPKNVMAIWVVDGSGKFVKTVKRMARSRINYLYKWNTDRGGWTNVNGVSGATINNHQTHTVVWDCRSTNNVVVPDGTYLFRVEYTTKNGQGPYSTNWMSFVKGPTAVTTNYPNLTTTGSTPGGFTGMTVKYAPVAVAHDVAVTGLSVPAVVNPGGLVSVPVIVSNLTATAETFVLALSNDTAGVEIGRTTINALAGRTARTNSFAWDTTGLADGAITVSATAGPVVGETSVADNTRTAGTVVRTPIHDVAVAGFVAPRLVAPGVTSNLTVYVSNLGDFAESFTVAITDRTAGASVRTWTLTGLPAFGSTNLTHVWNTTGLAMGYHALEAVASPVAGETDPANNARGATVAIASGTTTNALQTRGAVWRYNDKGLDLHSGPWTAVSYYDGHWGQGPAPLGYGTAGAVLAAVATTLGYGPSANPKYPCYYFRREVTVDVVPLTLTGRIMRDDGVVVYINGVEAYRTNIAAGATAYTNYATGNVGNPATTNYHDIVLDPSLLRAGRNVIAAEVHQVSAGSSDITFDLELTQEMPNVTVLPDVAVQSVSAAGSAVAGDQLEIRVKVANPGAATVSPTVTLTDTNTATSVGSAAATSLLPGETRELLIRWNTGGAAAGAHGLLAAAAAQGGETNLANNAAYGSATISSSGFGLDPFNGRGSIGGYCGAVVVSGGRAYVGEGATLCVYDLASPATPALLGRLHLAGEIEGLAVAGTMVYAAAGASGVHFVDAATPGTMILRSTYDTSGHAHGVALSGSTLYVADGAAGVRVVDVTNPGAPQLLGAYHTVGPARALTLNAAGTTLYVLDENDGLFVLNAGGGSPTLLGRLGLVNAGQALALSGTTLFVADGEGTLKSVNVATPAAPALLGTLLLPSGAGGLAVVGGIAYVAAGAAGLVGVNVSAPAAMIAVTTNALPGEAVGLALNGTVGYVAGGAGGLQVLNLSAPGNPVLAGAVGQGQRARGSAVAANGLLYVAAGAEGVGIYNVTNPAAPVRVGTYAGASNAMAVALGGSLLYVADGQYGLRVASLADPLVPVTSSTYAPAGLGAVRAVAGSANRAAITDGRFIRVLNTAVPAAPALIGAGVDAAGANASCFVYGLALAGSNVLAAAGNAGLLVLDVNSGAQVGSLATAAPALAVAGEGANAYLAGGAAGWMKINLANPGAPALVGTYASAGGAVAVSASGGLLHLADGDARARTLQPLTPVELNRFGPLVRTLQMSSMGTMSYASEDTAGLAVLDAASNDVNLNGIPDGIDQQIVDANPGDAIVTIYDVDPKADFDRDGGSNKAEATAGTNPVDANSKFAFSSPPIQAGAAAQFVVRWYSVNGKTYNLYRTTNLVAGAAGLQLVRSGIAGVAPVNSFTDTTSEPGTYYVVEVH